MSHRVVRIALRRILLLAIADFCSGNLCPFAIALSRHRGKGSGWKPEMQRQ